MIESSKNFPIKVSPSHFFPIIESKFGHRYFFERLGPEYLLAMNALREPQISIFVHADYVNVHMTNPMLMDENEGNEFYSFLEHNFS